MPQLYTVNMVAKKMVSVFDKHGNKVSESEQEIALAYHDLPAQTAHTYKTKFPDNKVEITLQQGEFRREQTATFSGRRFAKTTTAKAAPAPAKPDATVTAASTGNMTAAINAELAK